MKSPIIYFGRYIPAVTYSLQNSQLLDMLSCILHVINIQKLCDE